MTNFEETINRLDRFCNKESISYAVIGGLAVIAYGYQRTTKDIDITVFCNLERISEVHDSFVKEYTPVYNDSLDFFSRNFVLPVKDNITKMKIDVAAGLTIFDETIIKRRKRFKLGHAEFYICTLEDLIVYKLFAARGQDLVDIEMLAKENYKKIDIIYLEKTVKKFQELEREDMLLNFRKYFH